MRSVFSSFRFFSFVTVHLFYRESCDRLGPIIWPLFYYLRHKMVQGRHCRRTVFLCLYEMKVLRNLHESQKKDHPDWWKNQTRFSTGCKSSSSLGSVCYRPYVHESLRKSRRFHFYRGPYLSLQGLRGTFLGPLGPRVPRDQIRLGEVGFGRVICGGGEDCV